MLTKPFKSVIVKNFPEASTEENIKAFFQECGQIEFCKILSPSSSTNSGMCLVTYYDPADAQKAISTYHNKSVLGKNLYVQPSMTQEFFEKLQNLLKPQPQHLNKSGQSATKVMTLKITNIPKGIPYETVRKFFATYGQLKAFNLCEK